MKAKLKLVNDQKAANGNGQGKNSLPQNGFKNKAGKGAEPHNGFKNGVDDKKKIDESVSALSKADIDGLIDSATYSTIPEVRKKALEMLKSEKHALRFISEYSSWGDTGKEAQWLLRQMETVPEKP